MAAEIPSIQVVVPGSSDITLSQPGKYTVFYEYRSMVGNRVYSSGETIPSIQVNLVSKDTGDEVPLSSASVNRTYTIGSRSGVGLFDFVIDQPGTYELSASYPPADLCQQEFGADLSTISYILSISGVITAFSFMIAAKIADKIGLINTMVFTHLPANILIILVAFAPTLPIAAILYLIRMALSQMDVPTRQSYIVSVVKDEERTAATGITNISRNISQALSPSLAGYLIQSLSLFIAPFLIGGILKVIYDIALYFSFRNIKPQQEEEKDDNEY